VAPTTFLSLPAIHSGEVYQPPQELTTYLQESIEQRSFMNRFARAGYATTLVNPIMDICPAQVATCVGATRLLRSPTERLESEAVLLLDLSLFRVAPVRLKRHIYRDGNWLISDRQSTPDRVVLGNRLFEEVARRFTLNGRTPTMKFLHTMSTHTPYVLNDDCTVVKRSLGHVGSQARCALRAVSTLLARLKQAGIYDTTLILVVADHGINPRHFRSDVPGSHEEWVHRAGAANPVFLLKPLHAQGVLKTAGEPVHLPDVGATLCAQSEACRMPMGVAAGTAVPGRPRRFNHYQWQHRFWRLKKLPGITTYEVIGRVNDEAAWRQVQ
jgi:hypothetical protein